MRERERERKRRAAQNSMQFNEGGAKCLPQTAERNTGRRPLHAKMEAGGRRNWTVSKQSTADTRYSKNITETVLMIGIAC